MTQPHTEQLSYEQAREELLTVVTKLEAGGATLEESLNLWERGEALASLCQDRLNGVQERLDAAKEKTAQEKEAPKKAAQEAAATIKDPEGTNEAQATSS